MPPSFIFAHDSMFIKLAACITALVALETLKHVSKHHMLMYRSQARNGERDWVEKMKQKIEKEPVFCLIGLGQFLIGSAYILTLICDLRCIMWEDCEMLMKYCTPMCK